VTQPPDVLHLKWKPYMRPAKDHIRITETACCGAYEWACQGGQFLILRPRDPEGYEETGRGRYRHARAVWEALIAEYETKHQCRNEALAAIMPRRRNRRTRGKSTALSNSPGTRSKPRTDRRTERHAPSRSGAEARP
jgi:hypothetical protein